MSLCFQLECNRYNMDELICSAFKVLDYNRRFLKMNIAGLLVISHTD
ncbi:unnamed protein product [Larinioides sclopetarius]|uniref:Uncharacterized protein n=1 Tax=Larinioides sclopetarius TaxID=280406 RepID=A0AAV1ZUG6_9ARAC